MSDPRAPAPSPMPRGESVVRALLALIPGGMAAFLFWASLHNTVLHRHPPSEHRHAHEWDLITGPVTLGLGLLLAVAAMGFWRNWSSGRTWLAILLAMVLALPVYILLAMLAPMSR